MTFDKKSFIEEKQEEFEALWISSIVTYDSIQSFLEQSLNEAITKAVESLRDETVVWEHNFIADKEPSMCASDLEVLRKYLDELTK